MRPFAIVRLLRHELKWLGTEGIRALRNAFLCVPPVQRAEIAELLVARQLALSPPLPHRVAPIHRHCRTRHKA